MSTSDVIGCLPIQLEESHRNELQSLLHQLPLFVSESQNLLDLKSSRFEFLIQLYSEEPHLLDPVLPQFVRSLISYISWSSENDTNDKSRLSALSVAALCWLQVLTRVRGYKIMIRLLPHEVDQMKPILNCLECYSRCESIIEANANAKLVFILSAWLMIICKNPFNLLKFDTEMNSRASEDQTLVTRPMTERIVDCITRLQRHFILRDESSIISMLLAQVLTRNKQNLKVILPRVDEAADVICEFKSEQDGGVVLISHLRFLIALFKCGTRKELKVCATRFLHASLDHLLGVKCTNAEVRNLVLKLLQRVALVLMQPRLAEWRYYCGHRSLEDSLRNQNRSNNNLKMRSENNDLKLDNERESVQHEESELDENTPYELIEKLIEEFLVKIYDRDGVVRWTAAKGIARICARLPRELAAEVVGAVLERSFEEGATASVWHGGCLALAELCRRGCLLPEQVPHVINKVLSRALLFDQSSEAFSLGVSVRDAACYICWAFARGFEAQVLRPCLSELDSVLVCLALFDREVNIRRAASAAFQENVGRNGCFVHGIHVLTIINYADVSLIKNCYLGLSYRIAVQFEEYRRPILNHLVDLKSLHWDESVRELVAEALEKLTPLDVLYVKDMVLSKLCARLMDKSSVVKHGTLFAIAGILRGLLFAFTSTITATVVGGLQSISASLLEWRQFTVLLNFIHENLSIIGNHRIEGYALLAKAFCRFIGAMCAINAPINDTQVNEYHDVLDLVISDKNSKLHSYASFAFQYLMKCYGNDRFLLLKNRIYNNYFSKLSGEGMTELERSSAIVPMAQIPAEFLLVCVERRAGDIETDMESALSGDLTLADVILTRLMKVIQDFSTPKWVFARVAAIKCTSAILTKCVPPVIKLSCIIQNLINASDDYTSTVSGDIGRFTRREAVLALVQLLPLEFGQSIYFNDGLFPLSHRTYVLSSMEAQLTEAIQRIVQRCCESIDELRATACVSLECLLNESVIVHPRPLSQHASSMCIELTLLDSDDYLKLPIRERDLLENIFLVDKNDENKSETLSNSQAVLSPSSTKSEKHDKFKRIDWIHATGYLRLQPLLNSSAYGLSALEGFILSAGSISTWTSENAYAGIALYMKSIKKEKQKLEHFLDDLLKIYAKFVSQKRTVAPILTTIFMLLNDRFFVLFEAEPDVSTQFSQLSTNIIRVALSRGHQKVKLLAISIIGSLLQFKHSTKLYRNCASTLISFLSSPYVALRDSALEQLFNAANFIDFDAEDLCETNLESSTINEYTDDSEKNRRAKILDLLMQTPWTFKEEGLQNDSQKVYVAQQELSKLFLST